MAPVELHIVSNYRQNKIEPMKKFLKIESKLLQQLIIYLEGMKKKKIERKIALQQSLIRMKWMWYASNK